MKKSLLAILLLGMISWSADLHPNFTWKDSSGTSVVKSKAPLSLKHTCGTCHDVGFIESHGSHSADLSAHNRLLRGISAPTDSAERVRWEQRMGARLPGGSAEERELNCLMCHANQPLSPNDAALVSKQGHSDWSTTASLLSTDLVDSSGGKLNWNLKASTYRKKNGVPWLKIGKPISENCGQCHAKVELDTMPVSLPNFSSKDAALWQKGQLYSSQKVRKSALNIKNKKDMDFSWDVHAKRGLNCSDCHNSPNNPAWLRTEKTGGPGKLQFDARRGSISDYLVRPDHRLVSGGIYKTGTTHGAVLDCSNCHDAKHTGQWIYRSAKHFEKLSCQACHIPEIHTPVLQSVDATSLDSVGEPKVVFRNVDSTGLIHSWKPVLLRREIKAYPDGRQNHGSAYYPYNPVTYTFWIDGKNMIDRSDLKKAIASLNSKSSSEKEVAEALKKLGYKNPMIQKEVRPYPISHNAVEGKWATRTCTACHGDSSILKQGIVLEQGTNGQKPQLESVPGVLWESSVEKDSDSWKLQKNTTVTNLYVFGNDRIPLVDWGGLFIVIMVIAGISLHGGLRIYFAKKRGKNSSHGHREKVYMYTVYERFWHWMQAMTILLLLWSGLEIHLPSTIHILGIEKAIWLHNAMGVILAINAFLAMFYHFASGDIKQFLPEPKGFLNEAIRQQLYYLQGIFTGAEHPFHKNPEHKLNPLQQITYLGLLNILLPLQVLTGFLMLLHPWTCGYCDFIGGLQTVATVHSAGSWLLGAFVIMHIYLTTTGERPADYMKAMVTGWEEDEGEK